LGEGSGGAKSVDLSCTRVVCGCSSTFGVTGGGGGGLGASRCTFTAVNCITLRGGGGAARLFAIQLTARAPSAQAAAPNERVNAWARRKTAVLVIVVPSLDQGFGGEPDGGDVEAGAEVEHVDHALVLDPTVAAHHHRELGRERLLLDHALLPLCERDPHGVQEDL